MNAIAKPNPNDSIDRFRESHHRIAQYFALGMTESMITRKTGVSRRRLTILLGSPAFQDLITQKSKTADEILSTSTEVVAEYNRDTIVTMSRAMNDRAHDIADGVEQNVSISAMTKLFEVTADRFGFGKHTTTTHKHDFASALDNAINRSGKAKEVEAMKVIDAEIIAPHGSIQPQRLAEPAPMPSTPARLPAPQPKRSIAAVLSPVRRRRVA